MLNMYYIVQSTHIKHTISGAGLEESELVLPLSPGGILLMVAIRSFTHFTKVGISAYRGKMTVQSHIYYRLQIH